MCLAYQLKFFQCGSWSVVMQINTTMLDKENFELFDMCWIRSLNWSVKQRTRWSIEPLLFHRTCSWKVDQETNLHWCHSACIRDQRNESSGENFCILYIWSKGREMFERSAGSQTRHFQSIKAWAIVDALDSTKRDVSDLHYCRENDQPRWTTCQPSHLLSEKRSSRSSCPAFWS